MKQLGILSLLLCLLAFSACSSAKIRYQSKDFVFETLLDNRIAVAGVILNQRLEDDNETEIDQGVSEPLSFQQADRWSHHLGTQFQIQAPELECWPWVTISDQVAPELMEGVFQVFGRGSILNEELLADFAEQLPGTRFLLLTRVDNNDLRLGQTSGSKESPSLDQKKYSQIRTIQVRMELYDLSSLRSVWSASVEKQKGRPLNSQSGGSGPSVKVARDPDVTGGIKIVGKGGLAGGPTLEEVLPAACQSLVSKLLEPLRQSNPAKEE